MNYQDIIVYDFETTSVDPRRCQPLQLGAVAIHGRKLEIHPDSSFVSFIKPVFDLAECERLGLDPVTDEALQKNGIKMEEIEDAPSLKTVWDQFQQYVARYNYKNAV
jgi:DNA polymerase III epsilon subunit-like protein